MPPDPKRPLLMAGLGTGLAPFRAMVQARQVQHNTLPAGAVGPAALYFGCRHRAKDYLYGDEFEALQARGVRPPLVGRGRRA